MSQLSRVLIIDRRCVIGTCVCRTLATQGCEIDIFAYPGSAALRSRHCHRVFAAPPLQRLEAFLNTLRAVMENERYDAIHICNESVLEVCLPLTDADCWEGLLLPERRTVQMLLSKNRTVRFLAAAGIATPRTLVPANEQEVESFARELGFPLVIKGEKGESAENVRMVRGPKELLRHYREVMTRETLYGGQPALQEFIPGTAYSIGGLFYAGQALRVCAHRKILTYPAAGGVTLKGITERPPGLLDQVFTAFEALRYSGLGHVEFIRDARDGKFKFLEINPRLWGSIGIAAHAGVDFFSPYRRLVKGVPVAPDLNYQLGVQYHRFSKELSLLLERPTHIFRFVKDAIDPRVKSDFEWLDPGPHLTIARRQKLVSIGETPELAATGPAFSIIRHEADGSINAAAQYHQFEQGRINQQAEGPFDRVARALERSGHPYCVLHGWEMLGNSQMSDIDLAVSPSALAVLEDTLERDGWKIVQLLNYEIGGYFFVAVNQASRRDFLCIDAITEFRDNGRLYLRSTDLLGNFRKFRGLTIAAPETEFAYLLVKKVLKGAIPQRQRLRLAALHDCLDDNGTRIANQLFGETWGGRITYLIANERWDEFESQVKPLRRALRRRSAIRYPGKLIIDVPAVLNRLIGRVLHPTGLVLALLGPDGSGKSTLARTLAGDLAPVFRNTIQCHQRPDLLRRIGHEIDPQPHARPVLPVWASLLKLFFLLVDYLVGFQTTVRRGLIHSDLVIFDRYYHDILVDPVRYRFNGPMWAARLMSTCIPSPDLFIVLDCSGHLLLNRKRELPLEVLERLRASYRALPRTLKSAFLVDASRDAAEVAAAAETAICEYLHERYLARRHRWFSADRDILGRRDDKVLAFPPSLPSDVHGLQSCTVDEAQERLT